jgi:hypothetical protein
LRPRCGGRQGGGCGGGGGGLRRKWWLFPCCCAKRNSLNDAAPEAFCMDGQDDVTLHTENVPVENAPLNFASDTVCSGRLSASPPLFIVATVTSFLPALYAILYGVFSFSLAPDETVPYSSPLWKTFSGHHRSLTPDEAVPYSSPLWKTFSSRLRCG